MKNRKKFKKVGTHNGRFHADEVMATAILSNLFEIDVVRTRNGEILGKLDIVYDVGGGEFDHHGIEKVYREDGIPYAACGLIWNKFGRDAITAMHSSLREDEIESIFNYVDRFLIEAIDAQDNGVGTVEESIPTMSLSTIISGFNPPWYLDGEEDNAFYEAVKIAGSVLKNTIVRRLAILKSKDIVVKAYKNREIPEIVVLGTYCMWEEAIHEIDTEDEVELVIYPDKDNYALQTIRGRDGRAKINLPRPWAGKENQELASITGVKDAVFCHTGRFFAVAGSLEGVKKMAKLALGLTEEE